MKIVKGVLNIIIAFFLTIVILANFALVLVSNTILKKDYMLSLIEENGYYEKVATDLQNGFEEYKYQSGLPDEVFQNLYSENDVRKDINSIVNNVYDGAEVTNSSENVRTKIAENVNRYLTQNSIVLAEQEQKNITDFENLMVEVYETKVNSAFGYVKNIHSTIEKIETIVITIKRILFGSLIAIIIVALLLNLKTLSFLWAVIGTSLLASGILLECLNFAIYKHIDIQNILLFTQSFSDLIKFILYDLLSKFNFFGILWIVLGMIGIIIGNYNKYNDMR